ncbi:MAG TPA: hypothetical protein VFT12_08730, partial [Thermoanaerobaculia bacterium]|nr:hypothetical protein [Thermoanaerobaculia bacterium]
MVLLFATSAFAQERVAIFRSPGFPTTDAPAIAEATLDEAVAGLSADSVGSLDGLDRYGTLVLPYGSSFPLEAWPHIRTFIRRGGNLVVLGGAPFHQPVLGNNQPGVRQTTWAHELLIGPADLIDVGNWSVATPEPSWSVPISGAKRVWALTLRLARETDMPGEHGSEGPREAVVRPLVHLVADGLPRAAPLLEIDRIRGSEAGARWIFAPTDAPLTAPVIRAIVQRAMQGASHVDARPVHATVELSERPRIVVSRAGAIVVRDDNGRVVQRQK